MFSATSFVCWKRMMLWWRNCASKWTVIKNFQMMRSVSTAIHHVKRLDFIYTSFDEEGYTILLKAVAQYEMLERSWFQGCDLSEKSMNSLFRSMIHVEGIQMSLNVITDGSVSVLLDSLRSVSVLLDSHRSEQRRLKKLWIYGCTLSNGAKTRLKQLKEHYEGLNIHIDWLIYLHYIFSSDSYCDFLDLFWLQFVIY